MASPSYSLEPDVRFYVVNGVGDGAFITHLLAQPHVEHVLLYEPDAALVSAFSKGEATSFISGHSKFRSITGSDPDCLKNALSAYFYENPFRLTHVFRYAHLDVPGVIVDQGRKTIYDNFTRLFIAEIEAKLSRIKPNEEDAFWGFLNTMDNFPGHFSLPPFDALRGIYAGKTGVVVAAGPSLDISLPVLKKYRDRCVVFACDAAVKKMLAADIVPDFISALERIGAVTDFLPKDPRLDSVPLVAPPIVAAAALEGYSGPRLRLRQPGSFEDWIEGPREGALTLGNATSVAHMAYVCLRQLGCDPILLIGQDLCYDPYTEVSHAEGVSFSYSVAGGTKFVNEVVSVPGYDGGLRKSHFFWIHFARLYGDLIARYGGTVYNLIPAHYGMPVAGTSRMDPEAGFARFCKTSVDTVPLPLESVFVDDIEIRNHLLSWRERLAVYRLESLRAMEVVSRMRRDHDPEFDRSGLDADYGRLFEDMESRLARLRESDAAAFDRHFLPLIMNSFLAVRIEREQWRHRQARFVDRTLGLIQVYLKTFNLIHLWASRCAEALERRNRDAWHFW